MKQAIKQLLKALRFYLSASNNIFFLLYYRLFYTPKPDTLAYFLSTFSKLHPRLTVIQVGANDGITHDPIHKFIKRDNWRGVLLEPQRYVYERYLSKTYRKNEGIHTCNAALGSESGTLPIYKIGFSEARWATGLTSFNRSHLEKAFESGHVARCADKQGIPVPSNPEQQIATEMVEVLTPTQLMERFQLTHIDLLQVDVEGYDYEVIKMFDIASTKPRAICFESTHLSKPEKQECKEFLESNGYAVRTIKADTIAMRLPLDELAPFFDERSWRSN